MSSADPGLKQKAKHELREMLTLSLNLAFFFCALVTYNMFLLNEYQVKYWNYGFALINALVITKVIMIGEYAKLGRMHENKSLFVSAVLESFCIRPAGVRFPHRRGSNQTAYPWS